MDDIVKANFDPLIQKLMIVLKCFMLMFHVLPLEVPSKYFKIFDGFCK